MYNFMDTSGQELFGFDFLVCRRFFARHGRGLRESVPFLYGVEKHTQIQKQASLLKRVWGPENMGPLDEKCGYITASGLFRIAPTYSAAFSFTQEGAPPWPMLPFANT